MSTETNLDKAKSKLKDWMTDIRENVSEGARAFSEMSSDLLEETKVRAEELYEFGAEKFEQASAAVYDYSERFKNNQEMRRLTKEKNELTARFGDMVFHEFKKNGSVSKRFLTTKKMEAITAEISDLDKQIIKIGKELDKKK